MTRATQRNAIKRFAASDRGGMELSAPAFLSAALGGMIISAVLVSDPLTSFAVWLVLLGMAAGVGPVAERVFAIVEEEDRS